MLGTGTRQKQSISPKLANLAGLILPTTMV
jgi:hypothetical protein